MRPPEGVSSTDFGRALQDFANVVGKDWVFTSDEDLNPYKDSYTPFVGEPELELAPSGAVSPTTVEQVQQVVRIANKYKVPLYTVSTGRNLGYGGSSPAMTGCVIVDLKRMNKILEVNVSDAYMVVEPGISFIDLQRHFDDNKYPLMISPPMPGWGSPIGNGLDHGVGFAFGDNFSAVNGMEVVLANGEVLRTGMGAVPAGRMWHSYRYGFGPVIDQAFSQSNFGIVTKAGFWLKPTPEAQAGFSVSSFKSEDMHPMIEAVQLMRYQELLSNTGCGSPIRECMAFNDGRQPYGNLPQVRALHRSPDGGSFTQWDALAREHNLPAATVNGQCRGPRAVVQATLDHAREVFSRIPGVTFTAQPIGAGRTPKPKIDFGELALDETTNGRSSRGHYYFSPVFRPQDIFDLNDTVRRTMIAANDLEMLDNYQWSGGGGAYPKAYMILMEMLVFDDVAKNRQRRELFKRMVEACAGKGWAEYRAPVAFQSLIMDQYSFGNHSLRRFHETIKDAIDPNGILSPGKSGIWPKRYRKA